MRSFALLVLCVLAPVFAHAASVTVTCKGPDHFVDNTVIPASSPITYRFYVATAGAPLTLAGTSTTCGFTHDQVPPGTYVFTATAVVDGLESDPSVPATITLTDTTCGPAPAPASQTVSCVAPTTGTWTQTHGWSSAAFPACWSADPWAPATPPAGACTSPAVFATVSTVVYTIVAGRDTYAPLIVGSVPLGVVCNPKIRLLAYNVVPRDSVTFTGALKPQAVLALCGP